MKCAYKFTRAYALTSYNVCVCVSIRDFLCAFYALNSCSNCRYKWFAKLLNFWNVCLSYKVSNGLMISLYRFHKAFPEFENKINLLRIIGLDFQRLLLNRLDSYFWKQNTCLTVWNSFFKCNIYQFESKNEQKRLHLFS